MTLKVFKISISKKSFLNKIKSLQFYFYQSSFAKMGILFLTKLCKIIVLSFPKIIL